MAEKARDPHIAALETVYAALKDLDPQTRKKVLSSVFALLDLGVPPANVAAGEYPAASQGRPTGVAELVNDKKPGTNAQRIALFAYHREKSESLSRFARDDLRAYFAKAKQPPAGNYDRDFVEAVRKGWIHEDGADSYLTTKGVEAVESGFEGERKYAVGRKSTPPKKRNAKRTRKGK